MNMVRACRQMSCRRGIGPSFSSRRLARLRLQVLAGAIVIWGLVVVLGVDQVAAQDAAKSADATKNAEPAVAADDKASATAAHPVTRVDLSHLQPTIEKARTQLSAATLPKPDQTRARLEAEMRAFEAYVGGPQSANGQAWLKFLKWSDLQQQLAQSSTDLQALHNVHMGLRQNIHGLEYGPFVSLRHALEEFIDAQRFGTSPEDTLKALDVRLQQLLKLTGPDKSLSELEAARDLSLVASYLSKSHQATELVSQIRQMYARPNVHVHASESFINRILGRPVAQPSPVDEWILGTHILGDSMVCGQLTADLLPHVNGASVCLSLNAEFNSNNIGYNRGVKVYTTGTSPVHAAKLVMVTPHGASSMPGSASTQLQTQIHGIEHKSKLIRKIATRRAAKQKPEADAIGQYRLQTRLGKQFNQQVDEQLAETNERLVKWSNAPAELTRLGLPKPEWQLQSTDSDLFAEFKEAGPTQFAAPHESNLPHPATGLVLEVHQSLPINLADTFLGGRTIYSYEMDDLVMQFTGKVSDELKAEAEGEEWSLTFAPHYPVEVEFADGCAKVSLRILNMARGDQELGQPATVSATYRPSIVDGKVVLERQGPVETVFARAQSGIKAVTLRSFMKGKFDKLFIERTEPQQIELQKRNPNLPNLTFNDLVFGNGWVQVSLK